MPGRLAASILAASWILAAASAALRAEDLFSSDGDARESLRRPDLDLALEWLARHRDPETGAWDSEFAQRCLYGRCGGHGPARPVRATSLTLLAMVGAGHSDHAGAHKEAVMGALRFLRTALGEGGRIGDGEDPTAEPSLEDHAIATLALTDAFIVCGSRLKSAAASAAARLLERWGSEQESADVLTMGWVLLALKDARIAELGVPDEVFTRFVERLDGFAASPTREFAAIRIMAHVFLGGDRRDPRVATWLSILTGAPAADAPATLPAREALHYFTTLATFQVGGDAWKSWSRVNRESLATGQGIEGCSRGSWISPDDGDPVEATALAALRLEFYYAYERVFR